MKQFDSEELQAREMKLVEANEAYHNGRPIMSDQDYDALWRQHKAAFEKDIAEGRARDWNDSIIYNVGAAPSPKSGFSKMNHNVKMESLDNVFAAEGDDPLSELRRWITSHNLALDDLVFEPKIDGLSLRLTYDDGNLISAVTRGDGVTGDLVTLNVLSAGLAPQKLHDIATLELNCEVYMTFAAFERLNDRQLAAGDELYANPRNAAAGILRRKDPKDLKDQGLSLLVHGVAAGAISPKHSIELEGLRQLEFKCVEPVSVREDLTLAWLESVAKQEYPTDGVVVKIDSLELCKQLGSTSRAPRWAVAFKFKQEEVETTLNAITVQVGRSGVLTPVAELEPVAVDGTVVSRATLHNEDQVRRLGLAVGDTVKMRKAGAIIPEILESVTHTRAKEAVNILTEGNGDDYRDRLERDRPPFDLLKHVNGQCPSCGSRQLEKRSTVGSASVYICANTAGCRAQMAARIEHMASRGCLNLAQMGAELCAEIAFRGPLELDFCEHPFDLFSVPASWFANLRWKTEAGGNMTFGASRADTLSRSMADAYANAPLDKWIAALGIPSIGENTAKEISRLVSCKSEMVAACCAPVGAFYVMVGSLTHDPGKVLYNSIKSHRGISHHLGPVSLTRLVEFVNSAAGQYAMRRMPNAKSDNYQAPGSKAEAKDGPLSGKAFVITGTLSAPRNEIQRLIEAAGGTVMDSVSAKTSVLVAGEKAGSKMAKATKLGISVWTEEELRSNL